MEKTDINKRFIAAVEHLLSTFVVENKSTLAMALGIKNTTFSEILNHRMNIGTDIAAKICILYNVNPEWLLMGRGSMLYSEQIPMESSVMRDGLVDAAGEASAYYKMYIEKDKKVEELLKENARLEERLRLLESEKSDFGKSAERASTKSSSPHSSRATSAGAPSNG